jgi:hypothetical protein
VALNMVLFKWGCGSAAFCPDISRNTPLEFPAENDRKNVRLMKTISEIDATTNDNPASIHKA